MEGKRINRGTLRVKKTGSTLYIIIGFLLIALATAVLVLWENPEEMIEYWYYFLAGGLILYGGGGLFVIAGALNFRVREPNRKKVIGFALSGVIVLGTLMTGVAWLGWELFGPKPYELYPREYAIDFDPGYKFSTVHGNFNDTCDELFIWPSSLPDDPLAYAWGESYIERGFVHMYNATKNRTYIDTLAERVDVVLNNSDVNNDTIPGYGTDKYEGYYVEYVVWDGMILMAPTEMANIIKNNATFWGESPLQQLALRAINISEQVIQKWNKTHYFESGDTAYYVSPPQNDTAIFNRIHALGRLLMEVYEFTENATYIQMVEKLARFFKNHLTTRLYEMDGVFREMYTWGYDWESDNSDTSHGCIDVDFAVMCHERGIVFTATDMARFANTFFDFVYRGRLAQNEREECDDEGTCAIESNIFADNVNGKSNGGNHYRTLRQGWFQLYRYYRNTTISSYVVFLSHEDLITGGRYTGSTLMQTLSVLREMAYALKEFPVDWL